MVRCSVDAIEDEEVLGHKTPCKDEANGDEKLKVQTRAAKDEVVAVHVVAPAMLVYVVKAQVINFSVEADHYCYQTDIVQDLNPI